MRKWALAVAALLWWMTASVDADYYRFIYVPGASREKEKDPKDNKMIPGAPGVGVPGVGIPPRPGFPNPMNPMNPMGKQNPNETKEVDEDDDADLTVARHIIIEVDKSHVPTQKSWGKWMIDHKYGKTALFKTDDIRFKRLIENRKVIPTVAKRYADQRKEMAKDKPHDPQKVFDLAEFALTHGLYKDFSRDMDELVELSPKHPAAAAYRKVKEAMKKAPAKPDQASAWKDRLSGTYKLTTSTHYSALYNSSTIEPIEVRNRLKRLEENYSAFFFWFATKGIALTPPDRRMVVVFVDKPEEFLTLHQAFEAPLLAGDGFLARRENLAIFTMTPLDEAYDSLAKATNQMWTQEGWNKDFLLGGKFKGGEKPDDSAYAQEVALLLKAMQDESELAAVSHVGSQQLAAAVGLLPSSVIAPQWIRSGVGSFFETPKGAYWPGTGAPHWTYLIKFRNWRDDKRLEKPEDVLLNTITDTYFHRARLSQDPADLEKAQVTAWALTYYLAQDQNMREGLMHYFQEIAELPRDMEMSRESYLFCFARAFGLTKETDMAKVDSAALLLPIRKVAGEWYYRYMSTVPMEMRDAEQLSKKIEQQRFARAEQEKKDAHHPMNPLLPPMGGIRPMPPMGGIRPMPPMGGIRPMPMPMNPPKKIPMPNP